MKMLVLFALSISLSHASQPFVHWGTDKIVLKHSNAQELAALLNGSEGGLIIVTPCWNENAIIISGKSDKLASIITFIKTHVDVPHQAGERFGDNIISR